jgi:hypothetical protein
VMPLGTALQPRFNLSLDLSNDDLRHPSPPLLSQHQASELSMNPKWIPACAGMTAVVKLSWCPALSGPRLVECASTSFPRKREFIFCRPAKFPMPATTSSTAARTGFGGNFPLS